MGSFFGPLSIRPMKTLSNLGATPVSMATSSGQATWGAKVAPYNVPIVFDIFYDKTMECVRNEMFIILDDYSSYFVMKTIDVVVTF
jgi:hypothetical protein